MLGVDEFREWLESGERGSSSETIVSVLTGVPISPRLDHPYDPADFRRCELLLRAVPAARAEFHRMSEVSKTWAGLVEAWDELVALGESEVPGIFLLGRRAGSGSAPLMYRRMRDILDGPRATP